MKPKGQLSMLVVLIILVVVLVLVVLFIFPEISRGSGVLGLFSGTTQNTLEVKNRCALYCLDGDAQGYCADMKRPLPLRLGNGRVIEGTCAALATLTIEGFEGVASCPAISCVPFRYDAPVCTDNGRVVDCSAFS